MSKAEFVVRLPILLRPDPSRVVVRPYIPGSDPDHARAGRIVDRILALGPAELSEELQRLREDFSERHHDVDGIFLQRFAEVEMPLAENRAISRDQELLIGAYFSHEYSYEAAALFNPSIVIHPDQTGVSEGAARFVLSLRAVGEGHISSIAFRTGIVEADGAVSIDPVGTHAVVPRIENASIDSGGEAEVRIFCDDSYGLSDAVIFPSTPGQRNGIEDLRMVRFTEDDGRISYHGTYTAYSGQGIRQELLSTQDFKTFDLEPMHGAATANKGMALFPRRIDGRFVMLGRQDNENISVLFSDDLYGWDAGVVTVEPRWPWEFVQIGNCGSPIEIDEGWLVITHGVGAMRNYALGACLLDKQDPIRLLGRLSRPLIRSDAQEREGYVPNVTYSCGAILHGRSLLLPYAIADSFTTFASAPLDRLLAAMS